MCLAFELFFEKQDSVDYGEEILACVDTLLRTEAVVAVAAVVGGVLFTEVV